MFDRRGTRPKGSPPSFCEALREAVLALPGVGAEPSEPFEGKAGQHESTCANVNQIWNKCVLINRKLLPASALCALHCKRVYCMYVCMYACMHACMHAWMDGWMYACMHACIDGWMDGYVCMHACMHVCMYVCINVLMY